MLKSPLFFVIALLIIIANNWFFNIAANPILHCIQVIAGIIIFIYYVVSMMNFTEDYFPKKYEIPLFMSFIFGARATESIVRKFLISYSPVFYEKYKLYIFAISVIILLALVYLLNKKNKNKKLLL